MDGFLFVVELLEYEGPWVWQCLMHSLHGSLAVDFVNKLGYL